MSGNRVRTSSEHSTGSLSSSAPSLVLADLAAPRDRHQAVAAVDQEAAEEAPTHEGLQEARADLLEVVDHRRAVEKAPNNNIDKHHLAHVRRLRLTLAS